MTARVRASAAASGQCPQAALLGQVIMAVKRTGVLDALAAGPKSADELAKELGALPLPPAVHSPGPRVARACRSDRNLHP